MAKYSDLLVELRDINKRLMPKMIDAVEQSGEIIASTARDNCTPGKSPYDSMAFKSKHPFESGAPFKTGAMRDSIQSNVAETGRDSVGAVIWTDVEYASYVHEGTSKMQARPFITDAAKEREPEVKVIMQEAFASAVRGEE